MRARVLLPDPDSPTMASVSPSCTSRSTVSTARDHAAPPDPASAADEALDDSARGKDRLAHAGVRRRCGHAAAGRREQAGGVGIRGASNRVNTSAVFDDPAAVHDIDPVAQLGDHAEIVGDDQQRHCAPG